MSLDLDLSRRVVSDKKTTSKLLPSRPVMAKNQFTTITPKMDRKSIFGPGCSVFKGRRKFSIPPPIRMKSYRAKRLPKLP